MVTYQLILNVSGPGNNQGIGRCDGIDESRGAIEFSIQNSASMDNHWIPLRLSCYHNDSVAGSESTTVVRGYETPVQLFGENEVSTNVTICGDMLPSNKVQFRWIGTAKFDHMISNNVSDMWPLASVNIVVKNKNNIAVVMTKPLEVK